MQKQFFEYFVFVQQSFHFKFLGLKRFFDKRDFLMKHFQLYDSDHSMK